MHRPVVGLKYFTASSSGQRGKQTLCAPTVERLLCAAEPELAVGSEQAITKQLEHSVRIPLRIFAVVGREATLANQLGEDVAVLEPNHLCGASEVGGGLPPAQTTAENGFISAEEGIQRRRAGGKRPPEIFKVRSSARAWI